MKKTSQATSRRCDHEEDLQETEFKKFFTVDYNLTVCRDLTDAEIFTSLLPVRNEEGKKTEEEETEINQRDFVIKGARNALDIIKCISQIGLFE